MRKGQGPGGGGVRSGSVKCNCEKMWENCGKLRGNCGKIADSNKTSRSLKEQRSAQKAHRAPRSTQGGQATSNCGKMAGNCEVAKNCETCAPQSPAPATQAPAAAQLTQTGSQTPTSTDTETKHTAMKTAISNTMGAFGTAAKTAGRFKLQNMAAHEGVLPGGMRRLRTRDV